MLRVSIKSRVVPGMNAVFVVSWWRNKGLHTLNRMHNAVQNLAPLTLLWCCLVFNLTQLVSVVNL